MKRISTLFLVLMALMALPFTASAEEIVFDFTTNNFGFEWASGLSDAGNVAGEKLTVGDVWITNVNGNTATRLFNTSSRGNHLQVYKEARMVFHAAEGKYISKIVFETQTGMKMMAQAGNGSQTNDDEAKTSTWEGLATAVKFDATATGYYNKITVTTATPYTPAALEYTEVANIAAFNALETGTLAKLSLTNARVNGYYDSFHTYYVEDETGATEFTLLPIVLKSGDVLNGFVLVKKDYDALNYDHKARQAEDFSKGDFTTTEGTLTGTAIEVKNAGAETNIGKLFTISNVAVTKEGRFYYANDGNGNKIQVKDELGVLTGAIVEGVYSSITGIIIYNGARFEIMPISNAAMIAAEAFTTVYDFANNNLGLTYGEGGTADQQNAGNLAGKKLTQGDVTMTFVNSPSIAVRAFNLPSKGKHFQIGTKNGKLRITAMEGRAITKIEVTQNLPESSTNFVKWTVDKGAGTWSEDMKTWEGNATSVRFNTTSYAYINSIKVTTSPANAETIVPTADEYTTEVSTLAELNALPAGTLVKLNLNNVTVTTEFANKLGYYIQDETAGTSLYATELNFNINDVLNGYVYLYRADNEQKNPGNRVAMAEDTNADNITVTPNGSYTIAEGATVESVNKATNICKVVKFNNVKVKGTSKTAATITDSEEGTIKISNPGTNFCTSVYTEDLSTLDIENATVVGILIATASSGNQVYPISITANSSAHIQNARLDMIEDNQVFNLNGVRLSNPQKGINIINGHKVAIK